MSLCPHLIFFSDYSFFLAWLHICFFNHNLRECLYVCTCVLGKHPELKQISEGTLPWSKQRRIQLTGAYCVTHNLHGSDTVHTAGSRTADCKAPKMFKWISWYFFFLFCMCPSDRHDRFHQKKRWSWTLSVAIKCEACSCQLRLRNCTRNSPKKLYWKISSGDTDTSLILRLQQHNSKSQKHRTTFSGSAKA